MIDNENLLKEGFLWFPPHGVLGQLKKSWQKKYCQLFKCSKNGVDRLEVFDNEEEVGKISSNVIITLENCIKITQDAQKHQPHVFVVISKSSTNYFSANSEEEMNEWISVFQVAAFKDNFSVQAVEEDNDLYCSSGDAGVFNVKLVSSAASNRCGLSEGYYTLLASPFAINLVNQDDQTTLYSWPYHFIRRYGYGSGKFTFEAGRKCESGEGEFHFEHPKEIFRCIASRMRNMKNLLNREPALICDNNQFQAASTMLAGSRSPLPPSPDNVTSLLDSENGGLSSLKPLMPYFNPSGSSVQTTRSLSTSPLPLKPKYCQTDLLTKSEKNEFVFSNELQDIASGQPAYDDVEVRNEAWRKMGVDVVNHPQLFKIIPMQTILPPQTAHKADKTEPQKIFFVPTNSLNDYDRLQHIGPTTKQNSSPGYKQIPVITHSISTMRIDDPIFPCRRPDDFKGYGKIRKTTTVDASVEAVSKQLCEDLRYVLYKTERV